MHCISVSCHALHGGSSVDHAMHCMVDHQLIIMPCTAWWIISRSCHALHGVPTPSNYFANLGFLVVRNAMQYVGAIHPKEGWIQVLAGLA
jgi:hypothetical protein